MDSRLQFWRREQIICSTRGGQRFEQVQVFPSRFQSLRENSRVQCIASEITLILFVLIENAYKNYLDMRTSNIIDSSLSSGRCQNEFQKKTHRKSSQSTSKVRIAKYFL